MEEELTTGSGTVGRYCYMADQNHEALYVGLINFKVISSILLTTQVVHVFHLLNLARVF